MKHLSWRNVAPLVAAVALLFGATAQAKVNTERGKIVSTNWNKMEMEIKHSQSGNVGTWKVARNCRVRFTDQKEKFPNPKLSDLKPTMYVFYQFEAGTDLIQDIEVREVGYNADRGGPGVQQKAVVTNLDINKGHLEVMLDPGGRKTFEVDPKSQLRGIKQGDRVTILIDSSKGREIITKISK